MLFRSAKNRKFQYRPSYYDETKDQESESRKKISFRRNIRAKRKKSWLGLLILIIIIFLLIINFNKMRTKTPQEIELKNMEVVK